MRPRDKVQSRLRDQPRFSRADKERFLIPGKRNSAISVDPIAERNIRRSFAYQLTALAQAGCDILYQRSIFPTHWNRCRTHDLKFCGSTLPAKRSYISRATTQVKRADGFHLPGASCTRVKLFAYLLRIQRARGCHRTSAKCFIFMAGASVPGISTSFGCNIRLQCERVGARKTSGREDNIRRASLLRRF